MTVRDHAPAPRTDERTDPGQGVFDELRAILFEGAGQGEMTLEQFLDRLERRQ